MYGRKPSASPALSKRKTGKTTWVWAVLIVMLASGGIAWYFFFGLGSQSTSGAAEPETKTTTVQRGDISVSANGSGKLVAYHSVDLSFSTGGTVTTLDVKNGDMVKAGQVLASLGSSQTLQANLAAAKLGVLNAQKALTDLQQNAGLSLAQSYSDLVAAQETYDTELKKSQRLAYARCGQDATKQLTAALERATQRLVDIHAETDGSDIYISAKKAYDTALANYNACASYTTSEINSVQSALEVARTTLQEAQDQYDVLKAGSGIDPDALALNEANLKAAQARLANAEDQLAGITLIAPFDGKVTYLAASVGALVDTSKFITVADVSHSIVEISVYESDIDNLLVDAPVTVTFDALPEMPFTGKVIQVNPEMATSGQYRVAKGLAELDVDAVKSVSNLPLGLSATVKIVNEEAKNTLLVPVIALKDLGDGSYGVMVKGSDGQYTLRVVTIGLQDNDYAEITSGLQAGELVSTGTTSFIAAGSSSSSSSLKNSQNTGGPPGGGGLPPMP